MQVLRRITLPFINASLITAGLFLLMYSLVHMEEPELLKAMPSPLFTFANVPEDDNVIITIPKPPEPKLVEPLPDLPAHPVAEITDEGLPAQWTEYSPPTVEGSQLAIADGQLTLVLGYPPVYPNGALTRNIEGFAVVGFSVSQAGEVFDAYILESEPAGVFDRSALQAISKFRYRARNVNGKPVASDGQRYMFSYEID
ncbi:energy transducer TonB [Arenicella xantha]|uniref:Protein TonB n=1 Tax=Arenicella xantha TaxID=644221 RepID=A0A395JGE6_9GAMM|nr:energy transducer TonB [Arenicella xantha]RBP48936.1 outer membrane transport energization protein TonB [Arenicella xantha]